MEAVGLTQLRHNVPDFNTGHLSFLFGEHSGISANDAFFEQNYNHDEPFLSLIDRMEHNLRHIKEETPIHTAH